MKEVLYRRATAVGILCAAALPSAHCSVARLGFTRRGFGELTERNYEMRHVFNYGMGGTAYIVAKLPKEE